MNTTLTSASENGVEFYDRLYKAGAFIFGLLMIVLALERTSVPATMPNNSTASTHSIPDLTWQTLAEFRLFSQPGYDYQARTQVAEAVGRLNLPAVRLEQLKTAVTEATLNVIEHGNRYHLGLPVVIRVLISDKTLWVRLTDQGNGGPLPKPEMAELAGQQSPQGWGFFLIKRMMDDLRITGDEAHHTIELFLYLEGRKPK